MVLALALVQAGVTSTFAAEAPITPGSVLDSVREEKAPFFRTPPQVVVPVQQQPSQHDPRAKRFRVNAFAMVGNTVYRERQLKTALERFVDLELNLYDLTKAADTITAYYQNHGYTLARAFIPAQKVENGIVQIQIVEGRFGQVTFSGKKRYSTDFLAARTGLLTPGSLVTTKRLEHDLLLLNDLPGLHAKAVMEPGEEPGTTNAEIKSEEKLLDGTFGVNNFGRKETGQRKLEASLNINSPFGWGDQLALSGSKTEQSLLRYWKANYSIPLNTMGTRLAIGSSNAAYDVNGALAALGVTGQIKTTELTVGHPLVRSRNENQILSIGVRRNHLTQSTLGTTLFENKLTVMTAAYQINRIAADMSVMNVNFGLVSNFKRGNNLGEQDSVFARMEADVNYTAPFVREWDIYLRGNVVHSRERLPDTEKFSLGGPGSVRGFRPTEVRGDGGYQGTVELRHPFTIAKAMGVFRLTADAGEVSYKAAGYSDSRDRLRSAGFGASLYPGKGTVASIDVARPFGAVRDGLGDGKKYRMWVSLSASF